jgi:leucyl/phenylalanyl-tRNA--protein transferase
MHNDDPFSMELSPELIVRAYKAGIFPMAEDASAADLYWVCPEDRGIMPLHGFHVSKSLRKKIKSTPWQVKVDSDFGATIKGCANFGTDRQSTWINATITALYGELFNRGICHTVEVWEDDELVGGLYGLSIGGAFFGESMFHRKTDASKIALMHLVARLNAGGYSLLDTQFITPHLESLGGIEIARAQYETLLAEALEQEGDFYRLSGDATLLDCLQSISQTS